MLKVRSVLLLWALGLVPTNATGETARFPVVDLHVDLPYQVGFHGKRLRYGTGQAALPALRAGGVSGMVLPLFIPKDVAPGGPRAVDLEQSYQRVLSELFHGPGLELPGCGSDGEIRTWLAFEGAGPLADEPASLGAWVARGVRLVGLVHTEQNQLASSSGDKTRAEFGLTTAGRALVRQAHALGVAVDISHASDLAVAEVLTLAGETGGVVVATHSNARALADHPRNLTDAQLRGVAKTGGVIGLNFHSPFVVRGRKATLSDVVRQALHLLRVAGENHVAIGSDFEGGIRPAVGLEDASRLPELGRALLSAGLSDAAVRKLFAENALRVLCRSGK